MLPSQMRNITGGATGYGPGTISDGGSGGSGSGGSGIGTPFVPPVPAGVLAAAASNQCCFGDFCEDYNCKNDGDCEAAYVSGATCKIVGGK